MTKATRSRFTKPITIPNQIGGLFFADVLGPFELKSLLRSVYKVVIIEAKTLFLWMTMDTPNKVDRELKQWLKDTIPWMRAQHGLKGFKLQGLNMKVCRDLVATSGWTLIQNYPYSPEAMSILGRSWKSIGEMPLHRRLEENCFHL